MSLTLKRNCIRYRRVSEKARVVYHQRTHGRRNKTTVFDLKGIQFPLECFGALEVTVPTLASEDKRQRTPVFDVFFPEFDPYINIQRTYVHLEDTHGPLKTFALYYRYHPLLERNQGLKAFGQDVVWKGDMLIMLTGKRHEYIGMRNWYDQRLACDAVKCFLRTVAPLLETAARLNNGGELEFPREIEHMM